MILFRLGVVLTNIQPHQHIQWNQKILFWYPYHFYTIFSPKMVKNGIFIHLGRVLLKKNPTIIFSGIENPYFNAISFFSRFFMLRPFRVPALSDSGPFRFRPFQITAPPIDFVPLRPPSCYGPSCFGPLHVTALHVTARAVTGGNQSEKRNIHSIIKITLQST